MDIGWGVQVWGPSPWGGTSDGSGGGPPPQPPIGDFGDGRYERVGKRYRVPEQVSIRNVLFAVDGLAAKMKLGSSRIVAGYGVIARIRSAVHSLCLLGKVQIVAGSGTSVSVLGLAASIARGEANGSISMEAECEGLPAGDCSVGEVKVRAIRNPTDEEFLMMIARSL